MTFSVIGHNFPLLFLDEPGDGGGGGIGDVSDIPHGHTGDMEILERGADDEGVGDDAGDDDTDAGDETDKGDKGPEVFDEDAEPDKVVKGKEDEEEEDDKEGKDDDKEGKEDEEVDVFEGRPTLTDIKTKYPKIFKEFPELREVLFRENEFTKEFGTVEEAQDASVKARSFNVIEASLLGGDPSPIIEQLGENDPEALGKVVDNFLPTLLKQSESLYLRATVPVVEQFLWTLHEHGKRTGDVNLVRSAQHASNYIFGKPEIVDPSTRSRRGNEPHPAEKKLEEERAEWARQRFQEASTEVSGEIDTELKGEVLKGLDPNKLLNEWQREKLIEDILRDIDESLTKDQAFQRQMKALWQRAGSAGFPKDQRASIKSAFLARAKALVPAVRTRLRAKALGEKLTNSGGKDDKGKETPPKKRTLPESGRAAGNQGKRPPSPKEVDYTKTSDLDLISGSFVRKR